MITIRLSGWDLLIIFVLYAVVAPFVDGFASRKRRRELLP